MATDLQCFLDTVNHRRPSRILFGASFTPDLNERLKKHLNTDNPIAAYKMPMGMGVGPKRPEGLAPLDFTPYWKDEKLPEGTFINAEGVANVPSGFYHFTGYISPLRNATSLSQIENYPLEDYSKFDFSHMAAEVEQYHAQGRYTTAWVGHMYEVAWQIRGYEQFLMDMIDQPAWAQCLLDRLAYQNRIKAIAAAKAGVDIVQCGDDVANQKAMMFQPSMWREMMHSRWAKIWDEIHRINPKAQIWYHSDGNIIEIIPDLVDAGLNILNPMQPECLDIDKVHKEFGKVLTFDGTMGTQSTMPFGTPADVRARVKEVIDKYGRNGGLMISPTHILEPEVSIENIDAFVQACIEYGALGE